MLRPRIKRYETKTLDIYDTILSLALIMLRPPYVNVCQWVKLSSKNTLYTQASLWSHSLWYCLALE